MTHSSILSRTWLTHILGNSLETKPNPLFLL